MRKPRAKTTCQGPCGRALLPGEFAANGHLLGGRNPWCDRCRTTRTTPTDRERYRVSYQRSYQTARRQAAGPASSRWRVRVPGGWVRIVVRRRGAVEARCSWGLKMHAVAVLESIGCAEVEVHGRGGGRGRGQKHAAALVVGSCDTDVAVAALAALEKKGLATR